MKAEPILEENILKGGTCLSPLSWPTSYGKENLRKIIFEKAEEVQAFSVPEIGHTLHVEHNLATVNYICCDNTIMGQIENNFYKLESSKSIGLYILEGMTNDFPVTINIWFE